MQTVLITGATSGIGEGLLRAFVAKGIKVIAAGRNEAKLSELAQSLKVDTVVMDVMEPSSIIAAAALIAARHPKLDTLINNAGLQQQLDFASVELPSPSTIATEVRTNLEGLINVTSAFLPLLRRQESSTLVQVSSGLAFVPLVEAPVYSATKAAVHAFTVALRVQLRGTGVRVIELIPPAVDTPMHRGMKRKPPKMMSLENFVRESMRGFDSGIEELPIGLAKVLRAGSRVAPKFFLRVVNPKSK